MEPRTKKKTLLRNVLKAVLEKYTVNLNINIYLDRKYLDL